MYLTNSYLQKFMIRFLLSFIVMLILKRMLMLNEELLLLEI
jgi:hypothetical protein